MSGEGSPALQPESLAWPKYLSPTLRTQILRFLVIGGSSVAIDLVVYLALVGLLDPVLSKAISYVAGMLFGYVGNKFWTFESSRRSLAEPAVYIVLYALTLAVNVGLNSLCISVFENLQLAPPTARILAFFIATGTTTVLNFVGLKHFAFRPTSTTSNQV